MISTLDKIELYKKDTNVLCIFCFGSKVYGTDNKNSDDDFIIIVNDYFDTEDINIHCLTQEQFISQIKLHDIQALECLFLNDKYIVKYLQNFNRYFELNKQQLRVSISTICSNSWQKGKKKLTVMGDYEPYLAIKSIFHSLRILDFGIQIALHNKIINYSSSNFIFTDLLKLSEQYQREELWNVIDTKYRKLFNSRTTEFKLLCPKFIKKSINDKLVDLFKQYGLEHNSNLIKDIIKIIE
jgi:hypothetical protein